MDNGNLLVWVFGAITGAVGTIMTAFFSGKVNVGRQTDQLLAVLQEDLKLERAKNAALEARIERLYGVVDRATDVADKAVGQR